jgi:hypothetical protein
VVELTGRVDLHSWPAGTRMLCRREDAHPGAQLRFSDHDGHRLQVFLTDQPDLTWPPWSYAIANAPAPRTASAPPRPPALPTSRSTAGAATPSGWSWSCAPKTCCAGPRRCCWTAPRRGRTQDPALAAAARRRPRRAPRPPHDPAAATHLAMGHRPGTGVHPPARAPAALLIRPHPTHLSPARADQGRPGSAADSAVTATQPKADHHRRAHVLSGRHTGIQGRVPDLPGPHTAITTRPMKSRG